MNSRTRSWLLALVFMAFCVHPAMAATYYVRNDGSDANTGLANTAAAAWTTIQHAADLAAPGDEILIQSGTYNEVIFISRSGTATQPIVYRGVGEVYVRGFDFANSRSGLPYPPVVSYYLTLEHLRFRGEWTPARTDYVESGIRLTGVGDITITECLFASLYKGIYANPNYYTGSNRIDITNCRFIGNKDGISLSHDLSVTVAGGVFLNNDIGLLATGTNNAVATHGFFQGNRIGVVMSGGSPSYGLQGQNNTIRRSLFTSNTTGVLIGTEVTNAGVCYNDSVVNSTFHANTGSGIIIKTKVPNSSPQHLHNNIFLSNGGYGISNESGEVLDVGYSLAWNNTLGVANGVTLDAANHSLLTDPLLLAPAAGDFRLQEGSPCIDTGNPSYNSDPDTRGAVVDMGAKEFSILDRTAPVSAVTAPVAGAELTGAEVVLAGTAVDTGGATLTRVEVSTDGGATWLTATGTASWSTSGPCRCRGAIPS